MIPGFDLILLDTTAEISNNAKLLLEAEKGDRIEVQYTNNGEFLVPVLVKSNTGTLLSKTNTFSFRGKQKEMLLHYGDKFVIEQQGQNLILKGNGEVVYTSINKAVEHTVIPKELILDNNYNIKNILYEF